MKCVLAARAVYNWISGTGELSGILLGGADHPHNLMFHFIWQQPQTVIESQ